MYLESVEAKLMLVNYVPPVVGGWGYIHIVDKEDYDLLYGDPSASWDMQAGSLSAWVVNRDMYVGVGMAWGSTRVPVPDNDGLLGLHVLREDVVIRTRRHAVVTTPIASVFDDLALLLDTEVEALAGTSLEGDRVVRRL